eukprot:g3104.t1
MLISGSLLMDTSTSEEVMHLTEYVRSLEVEKPVILMGDFNSLSPADSASHEETGLSEKLQEKEKLRDKFLSDLESIDYRVHQHLLDAGLVDIYAGKRAYANGSWHTVPTQIHRDEGMHAARMRLDYIHFDPACNPRLICDWKREWQLRSLFQEQMRMEIVAAHRNEWRRKESQLKFEAVAGKAGSSCDVVCSSNNRLRMNKTVGMLQVGFCNKVAMNTLNDCNRMRANFPCANDQCYLIEDGWDMPAYVSDDTHDNYGKCLVHPTPPSDTPPTALDPKATFKCGSYHESLRRLCPCVACGAASFYGETEAAKLTALQQCQQQRSQVRAKRGNDE